jgi:hypothetical protein
VRVRLFDENLRFLGWTDVTGSGAVVWRPSNGAVRVFVFRPEVVDKYQCYVEIRHEYLQTEPAT